MDFFENQAAARRRTTLLVFYFVVAVGLIVVALNFAAAYGYGQFAGTKIQRDRHNHFTYTIEPPATPSTFLWRLDHIAWTTGLTLLVIGGGTFYRWLSLRGGGRAVAQLAGGRELSPSSVEPAERRLLNIVEEMSLASGVPMPAVFVLDEEPALNAFAAGYTPSDAAVAVTRGALEKLTRDELQGVIAHEFSHILNGDMRLNVRLLAVLFGILMIAMVGRGILRTAFSGRRSSRNDKGGGAVAAIAVVGVLVLAIGYIGYFFGRLIQSAVSRQREHLADAAAVQFTRNPAGIGGALKKIGAYTLGANIVTEQATQIRHFFFAQAFSGGFSILATHPALEDRIRAIDPQWDGKFPAVPTVPLLDDFSRPRPLGPRLRQETERGIAQAVLSQWQTGHGAAGGPSAFAPPPPLPHSVATAAFLDSVGTTSAAHLERARALLAALPPPHAPAARPPPEVLHAIFALVLAPDPTVRTRQLETIRVRHGVPFAEAFGALAAHATGLSHELRLPLLNLALPALRALPAAEVLGAIETTKLLIAADAEVTLFEFMLEKALERHVAAPARGDRPGVVNFYSFGALAAEIGLLLSALARVGSESPEETSRAFACAAARVPTLQDRLTLQPADACSLESISAALDKLVQASPAIRKVLLLAGTEAVAADGTIEPDEADLLRAVADALDCPIPPLLGGAA